MVATRSGSFEVTPSRTNTLAIGFHRISAAGSTATGAGVLTASGTAAGVWSVVSTGAAEPDTVGGVSSAAVRADFGSACALYAGCRRARREVLWTAGGASGFAVCAVAAVRLLTDGSQCDCVIGCAQSGPAARLRAADLGEVDDVVGVGAVRVDADATSRCPRVHRRVRRWVLGASLRRWGPGHAGIWSGRARASGPLTPPGVVLGGGGARC